MESSPIPAQTYLTLKADYDGAWKEAFERYLPDLTDLCVPDVAAHIH